MSSWYLPLQSNEIRLLSIEPIGDDADLTAPPRCVLHKVELPATTGLHPRDEANSHDHTWPELLAPYDMAEIFKKSSKFRSRRGPNDDRVAHERRSSDVFTIRVRGQHPPLQHQDWAEYLALSYTWGPNEPTRNIYLNDEEFSVRSNLFDALTYLRSTQRVREGFKVWIDAICINQDDVAERGQQVGRMREIFASAWQVVMWLGTSSDDSDLAVTALRWIASLSTRPDPVGGFYHETRLIDARPLFITWPTYRSPLRKDVYRAIFHFMMRPYWRRMWILQEIAMARQDTPVACGDSCMSWKEVYDAAVFMELDQERFGRDVMESVRPRMLPGWSFELARDRIIGEKEWSSQRTWAHWMELMQIQRDQKHIPTHPDQHNNLRALRLCQEALATNERDMVYGILGVRPVADLVNMTPDYTLPIKDVYRNFSEKLVSAGELNILRLVSRHAGYVASALDPDQLPRILGKLLPRPLLVPSAIAVGMIFKGQRSQYSVGYECAHNLPTWAVCWTCKQTPIIHSRGQYRAAGTTFPPPPIILPESVLVVGGIVFDEINSLGAFHPDELDASYPATVRDQKPSQNAYGDLNCVRTALWRTLVGDCGKSGDCPAPDTYSWLLDPRIWSGGVAGYYLHGFGLDQVMSRNKSLVLCGHSLENIIFGDELPWKRRLGGMVYDPNEEQRHALSCAVNDTAWKRLSGTENGRIGLTPAATKLGDRIAVISGCSVPIVLRRYRDGWHVIGECYVHGVMEGELVSGSSDNKEKIKLY